MNIEIQAINFSLSLAQRRYVEGRVATALAADKKYIARIEVWLSVMSIAEGNVLKRCFINVELDTKATVESDCSGLDLRVAIQRAADQASREVSRSVRPQIRQAAISDSGQTLPGGQFQSGGFRNNGIPASGYFPGPN